MRCWRRSTCGTRSGFSDCVPDGALHPGDLTPARLDESLRDPLAHPPRPEAMLDLGGLTAITAEPARLLGR